MTRKTALGAILGLSIFAAAAVQPASAAGMTIVPGEQRFQVNANWKLWHENGMDPFHVPSVHASFFDFTGERIAEAKKTGAELQGHYCHVCGQSADARHRSIKSDMIADLYDHLPPERSPKLLVDAPA